jgi:putative iron-dependent peroxidase
MARSQGGIYAEPNLHGITLFLNVMTDDNAVIRRKLARLPSIISGLDERFSESNLNGYVAIGADYWDALYSQQRPLQLSGFPDLGDADRHAPRQPFDLLVSVRADRFDVCFQTARTVLEWLGHDVELLEQLHSFRFMDGRDLFGFIDAPDNPRGMQRRHVALVKADDDPYFAGGSYLYVQKFRHDLRRWEHLSSELQEHVMGRKKLTGERLNPTELNIVTHAQKTRLYRDDERPLQLLRQNMPWGDLRQQGLLAMYFSATPADVVYWLKQRYSADSQGDYDPLLDYSEAVSNALYFVPTIDFLEANR